MRNAGKRDRRRERAIASLGKHYSFPHSQPDSESFAFFERDAVSFVDSSGNTFSAAVANLRISRFNPD